MTQALKDAVVGTPCQHCHAGRYEEGTRAHTFERGEAVVVVKEVPGFICDACGHTLTDSETTFMLSAIANDAFERGAETEVIRFSRASAEPEQQAA